MEDKSRQIRDFVLSSTIYVEQLERETCERNDEMPSGGVVKLMATTTYEEIQEEG